MQVHDADVLNSQKALPRMFIWYNLVAASAAGGVPVCDL
jgi:hypothetical protein